MSCPRFVMSSGVETSLIFLKCRLRAQKTARDSSTSLGMTRIVIVEHANPLPLWDSGVSLVGDRKS